MADVTSSYGRLSGLIGFFGNSNDTLYSSSNFYKFCGNKVNENNLIL